MGVKCDSIGSVKIAIAAEQKVGIKIWRKVIGIVRDDPHQHSQDDEYNYPLQNESKFANSAVSYHAAIILSIKTAVPLGFFAQLQ